MSIYHADLLWTDQTFFLHCHFVHRKARKFWRVIQNPHNQAVLKISVSALSAYPELSNLHLTLNLTPVGRSAHTIFKRPVTQKVLTCKKSAKIIYFMENFCWTNVLPLKKCSLMPVFGLTVYSISHGCLIFAHIEVGPGQGRSRRWGESYWIYKAGQKSVHGKTRLFIRWLSVSRTSEKFLYETKDVAFCM
jgi:hypothetical protein